MSRSREPFLMSSTSVSPVRSGLGNSRGTENDALPQCQARRKSAIDTP